MPEKVEWFKIKGLLKGGKAPKMYGFSKSAFHLKYKDQNVAYSWVDIFELKEDDTRPDRALWLKLVSGKEMHFPRFKREDKIRIINRYRKIRNTFKKCF